MLSARGEEYDKLFGFEIGIDDYVVKPFSPKEIMARVNAVLKRHARAASKNDVCKFEGLEVDITGRNVFVDGVKVKYKEFIYLILHKPQGVVSATDDNVHTTVIDLIDEKYMTYEPFPVGRLDIDTEGLLLITNDGVLAHNLLSPKKHVDKTYYLETDE
jgi:16S rRNA pseudouridine516 synthase